ncbi:GATA zinc finger domain-containing protein 15 [Biomphalaria pfeifferi]|uniref:GATA zinc finger domain-containing protein 15 n=1 Tax=Biomphalaria pfeifferi TaxID=112525 RepID=A0AAD8C309_BIOPF|nr:GATA zinc finger domain-containing protein 15 [Biomphalaria pfeifferi]
MGLRGIILLNIIGIIVYVKVASLQDNTIYTNLSARLNKSPSGVAITATIICEVTSVIQPPPPPTFLTSLSIDRKTYETYIDSDESVSTIGHYETLCLLERSKSSGEFNLSKFFPPSKKWTAEYEIKSLNMTTITLNLTLKDIQCRDSGPYQCIMAVVNETELRRSRYMEATTSAPIIIDLNFEPNNETVKRSAKIELGLNVTLTCNITGPPDLKIFWKFANRSSDEEVYLKEFIFNAGKKWVSETGCVVRSYTSEIHKTVQRYEHGATYHCCVMNSKDELIAREQFTIWIKDLPDQNRDQKDDSDNHNGKVLFTFLYMKQHLALLLTIYIFVTD